MIGLMRRVAKWIAITFACILVLSAVRSATMSPEERAAEERARTERREAARIEAEEKMAKKTVADQEKLKTIREQTEKLKAETAQLKAETDRINSELKKKRDEDDAVKLALKNEAIKKYEDESRAREMYGSESRAELNANDFMRDQLKSPTSAKFGRPKLVAHKGNGLWFVENTVDAKNPLGVELRYHFGAMCSITPRQGRGH